MEVRTVRHRHRYEFNNKYKGLFEKKGMIAVGICKARDLVEIVELPDHPWFVGVQFHPEFKSKPLAPHPLFSHFVKAALLRKSLIESVSKKSIASSRNFDKKESRRSSLS